jgi:hypothetical protein
LQQLDPQAVGSQHIRRAKNFLKKPFTLPCRSQQFDSQQVEAWQQSVFGQQSAFGQHSAFGAGQHSAFGAHGAGQAGAGQHGACSAIGTYRGFFTHTVYSLHTGTFLQQVVGHISVTVYGTLTQTV